VVPLSFPLPSTSLIRLKPRVPSPLYKPKMAHHAAAASAAAPQRGAPTNPISPFAAAAAAAAGPGLPQQFGSCGWDAAAAAGGEGRTMMGAAPPFGSSSSSSSSSSSGASRLLLYNSSGSCAGAAAAASRPLAHMPLFSIGSSSLPNFGALSFDGYCAASTGLVDRGNTCATANWGLDGTATNNGPLLGTHHQHQPPPPPPHSLGFASSSGPLTAASLGLSPSLPSFLPRSHPWLSDGPSHHHLGGPAGLASSAFDTSALGAWDGGAGFGLRPAASVLVPSADSGCGRIRAAAFGGGGGLLGGGGAMAGGLHRSMSIDTGVLSSTAGQNFSPSGHGHHQQLPRVGGAPQGGVRSPPMQQAAGRAGSGKPFLMFSPVFDMKR
jgi:hypothetical protein